MDFKRFVEEEIQKALPPGCKKISEDKLLGRKPVKIDCAFRAKTAGGKSKLVNILVLPPEPELDDDMEYRLVKLRDYILSKDCLLVVVNMEEVHGSLGDMGIFVDEELMLQSPNFLWLPCYTDKGSRTCIRHGVFEELHKVLHNLWLGALEYSGPTLGKQSVNLELMKNKCWRCGEENYTVTGFVFPDIQLEDWADTGWVYYNQLIPLMEVDKVNAQVIQGFVSRLRELDGSITPVTYRFSHTTKTTYFAACCPACDALFGNFPVQDDRTGYLHSLENRLNGNLIYHSIQLDIKTDVLTLLGMGYEDCGHTIFTGWS